MKSHFGRRRFIGRGLTRPVNACTTLICRRAVDNRPSVPFCHKRQYLSVAITLCAWLEGPDDNIKIMLTTFSSTAKSPRGLRSYRFACTYAIFILYIYTSYAQYLWRCIFPISGFERCFRSYHVIRVSVLVVMMFTVRCAAFQSGCSDDSTYTRVHARTRLKTNPVPVLHATDCRLKTTK